MIIKNNNNDNNNNNNQGDVMNTKRGNNKI